MGDKHKRGSEGNAVRAPIGSPKYVRPQHTPWLALIQALLRREDWVEVVEVVRGGREAG